MVCTAESGLRHLSPDGSYYAPLQAHTLSKYSATGMPARYSDALISRLPVELLSRIFTLGMPEGEYPDFPPSDEVPFELLVSRICQHWKNVALRTHQLWTTIHFRLKPHIERAEVYLTRSQRHLIDILVDTCAADEHVPNVTLFREEFIPVFKTVIPHINRWRSLSLKVRDRECKIGARQVLSTCGGAPYLEYLQLWHIENWESPERLFTQIGPPPVVVFNKSLPSLKHIVLIGVNVPWNQSPFLEDLTTVEFALHSEDVRIPYDIWANMLATSPNLHKLSLHYSGPRSAVEGWPTDVINLPGLQELVLTDLDCSYIMQLVERLSMPNVTKLRLELHDRDSDFSELLEYFASPPAPATATIVDADAEESEQPEQPEARGPAFPLLETLVIAALDCTPASFAAFLKATPSIRHLELSGGKLADGLFEQLWTAHLLAQEDEGKDAVKVVDEGAEEALGSGSGPGDGEAYSYSVREARSVTRASSSDTDTGRSDSSTRTASTAATSPCSVHVPLASRPQARDTILLPELKSLKVSGVESGDLCTFIRFRQGMQLPVEKWLVEEKLRCEELETIAQQMKNRCEGERLEWYEGEEEDEEDEEGESVEGEDDDVVCDDDDEEFDDADDGDH
ncbi:hypothetical protein BC629DRAFT_1506561 [Irpex lacteus]|nr:hypothetical protein BC629DRAFT_1506561 [Irpex lacteus]